MARRSTKRRRKAKRLSREDIWLMVQVWATIIAGTALLLLLSGCMSCTYFPSNAFDPNAKVCFPLP